MFYSNISSPEMNIGFGANEEEDVEVEMKDIVGIKSSAFVLNSINTSKTPMKRVKKDTDLALMEKEKTPIAQNHK